jgi:hypothetical protein
LIVWMKRPIGLIKSWRSASTLETESALIKVKNVL